MFTRVADIVFPGDKVIIKADKEPQSEAEESKEDKDFTKTVMKECDKFLETIANFELVQTSDM